MNKVFIINNSNDSLSFDTQELSKSYNVAQLNTSELPIIDLRCSVILISDSEKLVAIQNLIILCIRKQCCGIIIIGRNFNINKISYYINSGANYYLNTPADLSLLTPYIERIFNNISTSFWTLDIKKLTLTNPDFCILRLGRIDTIILQILIHNIGDICSIEEFNIALDLQPSSNPRSMLQTRISRLKCKLFDFDSRIHIVNYPKEGYMLRHIPINVIM